MKAKLTPVRLSHLCGSQGPGSIVKNIDGLSVVIKDTRSWASASQIEKLEPLYNVQRIKECLGIFADLKMPPIAQESETGEVKGLTIPSMIFPNYAVCNYCNQLHTKPWNESNDFSGKVYCQNKKCQSKYPLVQGVWCNISENDQLSEVNWSSLCSSSAQLPIQKKCEHKELELHKSKIKCSECKSESEFIKRKNSEIITDQPWLTSLSEDTNLKKEAIGLNSSQVVVKRQLAEVNNPQVYMPVLVDGLVIPPESNNQHHDSIIEELSQKSLVVKELANKKLPPLIRDMNIRKAAAEFNCSTDDIKNAVDFLNNPSKVSETEPLGSIGGMQEDEYHALSTPSNFPHGADFVTTHLTQYFKSLELTDTLRPFQNMISSLVSVDRLRKINILKGFSRLEGTSGSENEDDIKSITPPDIEGHSSWLPAVELFGEGLFFTIDNVLIETWESELSVEARAKEFKQRVESAEHYIDETVDSRFILLHTLSHLIIRELELICGYPASSLEERIYSSREKGMQGVLIYTAVADINGSLGGLMEQAEPKQFLALLEGAFKHADWCSLDPICSEHKAQGPSGLNKAACHACSLLPETSCKYGNVLLDRVFIRGSRNGLPNFKQYSQEINNDKP